MPVKVFADFSGGEAGSLDLAKVPDNFWTGRNLVVYRSGALGPRPGLRLHALGRTPTGPINGLGYAGGARPLVYVDGVAVWTVGEDGVARTAGNISAAPNPRIPVHFEATDAGNIFMFVPNGGRTYKIETMTGSGSLLDLNTTGGVAGDIYGIRLVRTDTSGNRIYYSAPNNVSSWPSGNFLDVVLAKALVFLAEQRGHLTIVTIDGSWYVLTGVPGVNDTLRRITGGKTVPPQMAPEAFVDIGDDLIHYLSPINNYPGSFDGVEHTELAYLSMTPTEPLATFAAGTQTQAYNAANAFQGADNASPAFVLPAPVVSPNGRMLLKHNGVWGLHDFEYPMSRLWASDGRGRIYGFNWNFPGNDVGPQVLTTQLRLDRPAFTSDTTARPGDNRDQPLACEVTFPESWSENGDELRVREVMVDFIRWNTGVAETNRIEATVSALARASEVAPISSTRTWEQAGSDSPATQDGTKDRIRFGFGDQGTGAGWRLKLHGLRGIAIRQVIVVADPVQGDSRLY